MVTFLRSRRSTQTDRRPTAGVTRPKTRRTKIMTSATQAPELQPRMKNPAAVLPGAWQAIQALQAAPQRGGVPEATLALVHLRASQINGCSPCVQGGSQSARAAGESEE